MSFRVEKSKEIGRVARVLSGANETKLQGGESRMLTKDHIHRSIAIHRIHVIDVLYYIIQS